MAPLTTEGDESASDIESKIKKSWIQPCVSAGVRYWSKKNKLREINLKFGWMSNDVENIDSQFANVKKSSMSIRLSWMKFLNY